jgi:AcrR family transcriptional regulator
LASQVTTHKREGGTRELILDEAERSIARKGLDSFTLRDVADPLRIKVPSIYAHFASRDAIVGAVAERYIAALSHQFADDGVSDPMRTLCEGARGLVIFFASNPAYVRLKLRDLETPGGLPELSVAAQGAPALNLFIGPVSGMFHRLERLIARGVVTGQFRAIDVKALYRVVFGATLVSLTWPGQDIFTASHNADEVARILPLIDDLVARFVAP